MDVTKIRSLLFFAGVFILGLTAVAGAMNHKANTLHRPDHAVSLLCLGALGLGLLYVGTHLQSFKLPVPPANLANALAAVVAHTQPAVTPAIPAPAAAAAVESARDKTGWFNIDMADNQDLQAVYHLAEMAAENAPAMAADMLTLCRELNDKIFVIHHNVPVEVQNATKPIPKNPLVAS